MTRDPLVAKLIGALRSWGNVRGSVIREGPGKARVSHVGPFALSGVGIDRVLVALGPHTSVSIESPKKLEVGRDSITVDEADGARVVLRRVALPEDVDSRAVHVALDWLIPIRGLVARSARWIPVGLMHARGSPLPPLTDQLKRAFRRRSQIVAWVSATSTSCMDLWRLAKVTPRSLPLFVIPCRDFDVSHRQQSYAFSGREWPRFASRAQRLRAAEVAQLAANHESWWTGRRVSDVALSISAKDRWVGRVPEAFWELFPRRNGRRFELSRFDRRLLAVMGGDTWRDRMELILSPGGRQLMAEYGDGTFFDRLQSWAKVASGRYVESRPNPDPETHRGGGPRSIQYRLSRDGARLVRSGTEQLNTAPPMRSGGFRFYEDPKAVL